MCQIYHFKLINNMPRKSREISPTGVYHVMVRGINRCDIFMDDQDRRKFVKTLRSVTAPVDKDKNPLPPYCNIHAYCLMDNHVHLLLAEGAESVGEVMKRISVAYVSYFNKRYERIGTLFQGRFRSEPVGDAGYFIRLLRYIHQNPLEAQMVTNVNDYWWSSWQEYSNPGKENGICCRTLPFSNMSWAEVCELALRNCDQGYIGRDRGHHRLNDKEARAIIEKAIPGMDYREISRKDRPGVLRPIIESGVSKLQIERILGMPRSTIIRSLKSEK